MLVHLRGVSAGSLLRIFDRPATNLLVVLTMIALVPRLVAALFSQGYFAHDDHFLVAEAARSWADWLSTTTTGCRGTRSGDAHVPAATASSTSACTTCSSRCSRPSDFTDPKTGGMVVVRLLHAVWSLVVVCAQATGSPRT
jgi:hypothetical protein